MRKRKSDLKPQPLPLIAPERWKQPESVLAELFHGAQARAIEACDWYLADRIGKKRASQVLRGLAILLAAAGGLVPLANVAAGQSVSGLGYVLLAAAGVCFGFDRLLGLSSAWMRDMVTVQRIQQRLQAFEFDWITLDAAVLSDPPARDPGPYLKLLREFAADLSGIVLAETGEWVTEFQSGLQQLEAQANHR